jgi:hypothetical protein
MTPLKAEYIGADQLPFFIFRSQRRGGPYIPVRGGCRILDKILRGMKWQIEQNYDF